MRSYADELARTLLRYDNNSLSRRWRRKQLRRRRVRLSPSLYNEKLFDLTVHLATICHCLATEKLDDARAKAAIRAQIEADKKARAEKAARDKAIREGRDVPMTAADGAVAMAGTGAARAAAAASGAGVKGTEYKETRLQVRLSTGGQPLVKAFNSDAREFAVFLLPARAVTFVLGCALILVRSAPVALSEVAEWIASENLAYDASSVKMSTTFPRYVIPHIYFAPPFSWYTPGS
ncbi:hypothetical protein QFC22_005132 [Naganishia vaughanmartiniae]|uniref:Uncharacterized protein n=1 Tax=Naganishia vaughanmartiniae TaxID=1424756 RepID=A0ACC2WW74_9TREE|nr:hypothetical protein QFC22_005132 [Naganishia vaughanmartiniae]